MRTRVQSPGLMYNPGLSVVVYPCNSSAKVAQQVDPECLATVISELGPVRGHFSDRKADGASETAPKGFPMASIHMHAHTPSHTWMQGTRTHTHTNRDTQTCTGQHTQTYTLYKSI